MPPDRVSPALRRLVSARARDYCEYCRCPGAFATESFTVEHIKPRRLGGETTLDNLAWSCFGCNAHKHAKTHGIDPETGKQEPLTRDSNVGTITSAGARMGEKSSA